MDSCDCCGDRLQCENAIKLSKLFCTSVILISKTATNIYLYVPFE